MTDVWEFDRTEETGEEEPFAPLQYEIVNYPADTTLKGYLDLFKNEQIEIPEFQREYVWDIKRASKLVESFLLGLPVPGVFLYKPRSENKFKIIDGQQRILSVVKFQQGIFADRKFKLVGVQDRYAGKSFDDLQDDDKFKIEGSVLRSTIIQQLNPLDNSSMYQIFERLNTGGINLNPMEVRQAISYRPAIRVLKETNTNENWRSIINKPQPDRRLQDVELILRCFSLSAFHSSYEKPMKGFLNASIEKLKDQDSQIADLAARFVAACKKIKDNLGERPFHVRGRLNYGALDSIISALMSNPDKTLSKAAYEILLENESYTDAIFFNTSDAEEVRRRIEFVAEALE